MFSGAAAKKRNRVEKNLTIYWLALNANSLKDALVFLFPDWLIKFIF